MNGHIQLMLKIMVRTLGHTTLVEFEQILEFPQQDANNSVFSFRFLFDFFPHIWCSLFHSFLIQICWRFLSFLRSIYLLMNMNFVFGVQLVILYYICIADYFCDLQYIQRIYVVPIVSHIFRTFVLNRQNHIEYAHCAQFICIIWKCE